MALFWQNTKQISPGDDIRIVCEIRDTECEVRLSGRITIDSSPAIRTFLHQRLQSADCQSVTVNCYEVAYIDTSGLAILVETLKAARAQGKGFYLSGLRERPQYLLETTRLLHLFDEVAGDRE